MALALLPEGKSVCVADAVGDRISVVEVFSGKTFRSISLGPRPDPTLAERGERLFYDAHPLARRLDELP